MVRFNIIGHGFIDVADPSGIGFKRENQYFRFAEITLGRSTEFSVPMTQHNCSIMQFGEDVNEQGEMLRRVFSAQMVYDGGVKNGTIAVTAYEGEAFRCVFTIGNAEWITALQNKKLAECGLDWAKGVLWAQANPPVDANVADPTEGAQIIKYENGVTVSPALWNLVPSVNVKQYLVDLMALLGIPFNSTLPSNYWMVSGSMKGGNKDAVIIASTAANNMTITQSQGYLTVEDITIEYATANVFGALVGGGSFAAKGFKAAQDVNITMPPAMPICWLVKWDSRLSRCEEIARHDVNTDGLSGQTFELKKGSVYFFSTKPLVGGSPMYGWNDTLHPYSLAVTVERSADLTFGEVWYLRNNHPDMTVFEFLKSVAVAIGLELQVDGETGVTLAAGSYGQSTDFKALEKVLSVDTVARRVDAWGSGTRKAVAEFDSEDYVSERIQSEYDIDNEQNKDTKTVKSKFSEGSVGTNGILIRDVDNSSSPPKFAAKRWTLAWAGSSAWLQRVDTADPVGYFDISDNSTMMVVKVAATLSEFEAMKPSMTWLWRGAAFVWTDANWSDGVMTMTLQRVSRREGAKV